MVLEKLADPDSKFAEVNGLKVHYKTSGQWTVDSEQPAEHYALGTAFVLLHGFGASTFTWREVMEPLGELAPTVAFDRPAFGLTERPLDLKGWSERTARKNPYRLAAQSDFTVGLMDRLGAEKAILVGSSAGGLVAVVTALRYPARVKALVLVDAAVYRGGPPSRLRPLFANPLVRHMAPLLLRKTIGRGLGANSLLQMAWHDPGKIRPEDLEGYGKPLRVAGWERALWDFTLANFSNYRARLLPRLRQIRVPTLVITGDDDRIVPKEESERLARDLPEATLVTVPNCGHLPHEECPGEFMRAVNEFVREQKLV